MVNVLRKTSEQVMNELTTFKGSCSPRQKCTWLRQVGPCVVHLICRHNKISFKLQNKQNDSSYMTLDDITLTFLENEEVVGP